MYGCIVTMLKLDHVTRTTTTNQTRIKGSAVLSIVVAFTFLCASAGPVFGYAPATRLPATIEHQRGYQHQYHHQQPASSFRQSERQLQRDRLNSAVTIRGVKYVKRTGMKLYNQAVVSILSGSVAGAIGVGVAFPLDTLKTKAQVIASQRMKDAAAATHDVHGNDFPPESLGMMTLIHMIYKSEGIMGFYGGVRGMMAGQAIVKSVAFCVNDVTLSYIGEEFPSIGPVQKLLMASCFSGFITSFLVAPVERIKVMLQATNSNAEDTGNGEKPAYSNELECIKVVLQNEGWSGLMGRGLGPTLAREIPSYGIYFFVYGLLSTMPYTEYMGKLAPLVNGALSGMACWVPVYPIDVVKTLVQNTDGNDGEVSPLAIAKELYADGGVNAFFDGLTPKMLRAAVNHAVTFFVYDCLISLAR